MNRRDFLTFRVERRLRVAELSCERLYMLLVDSPLTCERQHDADVHAWVWGEPQPVYHQRSAQEVFDQIDRDLNEVDVLRITHREWLADHSLAANLDRVIAQFRARGRRIEILDTQRTV